MSESSSLPTTERYLPQAFLVAVNLLLTFVVPTLFVWAIPTRSDFLGGLVIGFVLGQLLWVAFWTSFSGCHLTFRVAISVGALVIAITELLFVQEILIDVLRGAPLNRVLAMVDWTKIQQNFKLSLSLATAFVLMIYGLLLPVRRLRGMDLGARQIATEPVMARQFNISELMAWTAIVAIPFGVLRLFTPIAAFSDSVFAIALMAVAAITFYLPIFLASLRGHRPLRWTVISVGCVVGPLFLLGVTFSYFTRNTTGWIPMICIIMPLPAAAVIGLNNLVLQLLGIHLRQHPTGKRAASSGE